MLRPVMHDRAVNAASQPARQPRHGGFRMAVIAVSVVGAVAGSVLLVTRYSGATETTRGVTATLRVPGTPGSSGRRDALWVALTGEPRRPVVDRPLLRVDPATGTVGTRCTCRGVGRFPPSHASGEGSLPRSSRSATADSGLAGWSRSTGAVATRSLSEHLT